MLYFCLYTQLFYFITILLSAQCSPVQSFDSRRRLDYYILMNVFRKIAIKGEIPYDDP